MSTPPPVLQPPWHTAEREQLQRLACDFAHDVVLPAADALDPHKSEMSGELVQQMAEHGWFGITIPAEEGGLGLGVFEYCLVSEELARAWLSVGSILARGQGLGTQVKDEQRRAELILELDGVGVPAADELTSLYGDAGAGEDGGGFAAIQRGLNIARVHTAARAVGVARAAVEDTTAYLLEREQLGHPLADFQALRFALADMAADVDQARASLQQVAHLVDSDVPCEGQAAMVKLQATEMAVRVTGQAMQLHGGNGYTTERRVERYWRDARVTTTSEGTSEIQRRIISDRMLPRS